MSNTVIRPVNEVPPSHPSGQHGRVHAVDTAKGIAILFVVFGHAWRGAFGSGLIANEDVYHVVDALIYAWHMPLFFFLSGLHFLALSARKPAVSFVQSRVLRLLWPFALWTWIFFAFRLAAGAAANNPVALSEFPLIPLPPYEHLWFLWSLFLLQLVVLPMAKVGPSVLSDTSLRWSLGVLAVALAVFMAVIFVPSALFGPALAHAPYLIAGVAFAGLSRVRPPLWVVAGALILAAGLCYGTLQGWPNVPVSLALIVLVWVMFAAMDNGAETPSTIIKVLRYLGHASMAIYLAHTIFSAAFRIGLLGVGVTSLPVHLIVTTGVGVLAPLLMLWVAQKLRLVKLLGL